MSIFNLSGTSTQNATSTVTETGQTIDAAVAINDPVFFDDASATWKKSDSTTIVPQGVFQGSGIVVTFGLLTTTGLTPGKFYFLNNTGGLSIVAGDIFIGYAKSATELLVDIDATITTISGSTPRVLPTIGFWITGLDFSGANTAIDKIIFSTGSISTITATLPVGGSTSSGAVSKTNSAGYIVRTPGTQINKLSYVGDTLSPITAVLLGSNFAPSGFVTAEVNNAGYLENGNDGVSGSATKINFTSELVSALASAPTTRTVGSLASEPFNSTAKGYWAGGGLSSIGSLVYSTEASLAVLSTTSLSFSFVMQGGDDSLGPNSAGYIYDNLSNNVTKFAFATDVVSVLGGQMITNQQERSAVKNNVEIYWDGGGSFSTNTITKFTFATETGVAMGTMPSVKAEGGGLND